MNRALAVIVLVGSVAEALAGAQPQTRPSGPSWPPPPATARIRFIRSLTPSAVRRPPSMLGRVWRALTGEHREDVMTQPYGIAVAPDGRVYVADTFARAVHIYDLQRNTHARLTVDGESLIGVAVVGERVFVTDSAGPRLLCLERGRTRWSIGRDAGLLRPTGLVAAGDRLHVVDTLAHRVVTVSLDGRVLGGFGGPGRGAGEFNYPTHIARGPDGRLYVTDTMNFRIQIFAADGRHLTTFGQLGDGSGDFNKPKGIALDSEGHVYVVEGLFDAVQIFDEAGRFLLTFGTSGAGDGEFWLPTGICIRDDRVYVADSANHRVQVFEYVKAAP